MKTANAKTTKVAFAHVVLVLFSIAFVLPFLWMLTTAIKPIGETMTNPPKWIPSEIQWDNYRRAILYGKEQAGFIPFLVYARNTVIITVLAVSGSVVSNSLVAYSFARLKWPGRDLFFAATLATMMIPFPVLMVPTFGLFRWLGWVGTFKPLWVPAWFGAAFSNFPLASVLPNYPVRA